jgi:SAM-dependent methyltransferase
MGLNVAMPKWADVAGEDRGRSFTERFTRLAAAGRDVHGEADFCARLIPPGARVLDAGCGTGRVAIRLAALGYRCVGVDNDPAMLAEAHRLAPELEWMAAHLAVYHAGEVRFDLVVAAGNLLPFLDRGTEGAVIMNLGGALVDEGYLVAGFGLAPSHLPVGAEPVGLDEYDDWCRDAGLALVDRYATWTAERYDGGGYAVSVHRRRSAVG